MKVSIDKAEGQLDELVRIAEAGEEVVLTRDGRDAAQLVFLKHRPTSEEKRAAMEAIRDSGRGKATPGPSAARSQDFLYGEDGLPS